MEPGSANLQDDRPKVEISARGGGIYPKDGWSIRRIITENEAYITSGRATNSPSSPEAGPNVNKDVTRWRYATPEWKEGDISVTCEERGESG